ncbi:hypothetical protein AVL62_05770 [Serinicoccus chungangensis]|uniref:Uncharacterized protein n=1 Tax=Serinicoccus chungangensis TaxID=767452 RepID=A0A0W8I8R3_9MICO|nr:hypothetical protein [Serinicoccus chungangensis]KUG55793.1 hypothetical protein AVL62_05770 [Serinicoccus chungangensis]
MPPVSSLIFVVILAVWAVYLVQHWVRRREHLATARSVDRFSEAMRVLERRRALPRPDVADQAPAAYSVSPLRPARPEVTVKRGGSPAPTRQPAGATAVGPTPAVRRARRAARLRAVALLTASVVMVALVSLGVSPVLGWWWSFAGVGVLGVTLLLVRRSARAARRRRRATTRGRGAVATGRAAADDSLGRRADSPPARAARPGASALAPAPAPAAAEGPGAPVSTTIQAPDSPLAAQARAAGAVAAARPARRAVDLEPARPALFDIDEVEAGLAPAPTRAEVAEEPAPAAGSWSPTPVPPPTYTLKARAYRGAPQPSSGSGQLPADGTEMALEEEFEDLPRVDRVG